MKVVKYKSQFCCMILQIQTVHICSVTSSEALWLHTDHYKDLIDLSLWRPLCVCWETVLVLRRHVTRRRRTCGGWAGLAAEVWGVDESTVWRKEVRRRGRREVEGGQRSAGSCWLLFSWERWRMAALWKGNKLSGRLGRTKQEDQRILSEFRPNMGNASPQN